MQVQGLFCSHCGGTVSPADEPCTFCQIALDEKDRQESLLCPECFKRLPDVAITAVPAVCALVPRP